MTGGQTFQGRIAELRVRYHRNPQSLLFAPLADLLRQSGEHEEALMLLEDGLVRHPDYLTAMVILGRTLFDTGRSGHGRRILQRVLERDPRNHVALEALATEAVDRGDLAAAVPLLETLTSLEPESSHWHRTLARCRGELKGVSEPVAEAVAEPVAAPAPVAVPDEPAAEGDDAAFATMTLVDIYLSQGYTAKALRALRRMADRFPGRQDILAKLGEVEALGQDSRTSEQEPGPGGGTSGLSARRAAEKQQFKDWLDCLEPGDEASP